MTRTTKTNPSRFWATILSTAFVLVSFASMAGCATQLSVTQQPGMVCSGAPVSFTASTDGTGGYFIWEANSSSSNTATYSAPGVSTRMIIEYIEPSLNCRFLDTFTIRVSPTPDAHAGNNGIITSGASAVTIGGKPTGSGGVGTLHYLWSTGDTISNPFVTITSPTSYSVTVTDDNQCSASSSVSFNYGGYLELMTGRDPNSNGRVVSDMVVDQNGMLYACGWADRDLYIHNNIQQRSLLSTSDQSAFFFVAKYDPSSVYPYKWGTKVGTFSPANFNTNLPSYVTNGLATHPFTPNIVQTANDIFVSYNEQHGNICRVSKTNGDVIYSNITEGFIISDMKDDGTGRVFVTGYCTSHTGANLGGVRFAFGDIFIGHLNTNSTSLTWMWATNSSLNVFAHYGLPSLCMAPAATDVLMLSTCNQLEFYHASSGILMQSNHTNLGFNNMNTRATIDPNVSSKLIYITDGEKIHQYRYDNNFIVSYKTSAPLAYGPIYDLKADADGSVFAITYSDVEKFDSTMNGNLWAPTTTNPYNTCGATQAPYAYSMPDGADRCLALNPNTNQLYVGGSHPDQSCPFSGSYSFNTKFGFIAEIDHRTGSLSQKTATDIVETKNGAGFSIYPNPVQNQLNISISEMTDKADFSIRNLAGQEIMNGEIQGQRTTGISTSSLASGVYLVQVKSAGKVRTEKLVKE